MGKRPILEYEATPSDRPVRVCLLTEAFYPVVGGAEAHALQLSGELARRGTEVIVVTRRTRAELARAETVGAARVHRVLPWGFNRVGKYLMMLPSALVLLKRRNDYDLVYVCGFRVLGVVGVLAAKLLGKRSILRAESCGELAGDFVRQGIVARSRLLWTLARGGLALRNSVLRRADLFLSITETIETEYRSGGVRPERIVSIPNGIDTGRFAPPSPAEKTALRSRLGLPTARAVWCYTGKLNRGKGLEVLLEVWRRLVVSRGDIYLVLVGAGGDQFLSCEADLRAFVARHDLALSVRFTGYVANVADFLRAADFFVLPSLREALSISVIEALAAGLPAVATRVGGMPDIVRDGVDGRLVDPGDPAALEAVMRQLMDDAALAAALATAARRTAVERFDIGGVAARHEAMFRRVLGRPGGGVSGTPSAIGRADAVAVDQS